MEGHATCIGQAEKGLRTHQLAERNYCRSGKTHGNLDVTRSEISGIGLQCHHNFYLHSCF